MAKIMLFSVAIVAMLFLGLGGNTIAQQPATGCVTVVEGDNLWAFDNNFDLADIAAKSPGLKPSLDAVVRKFTTKYNQLGIRIEPGEVICGVTRKGSQLIPVRPTTSAATTPPPAPPRTSQSSSQPILSKTAEAVFNWSLILILLALAGLALLVWVLRRRNPAGLPERRFAREGVRPEGARAYANTLAPQVHPGRPFVIISQTRQRARGAVITEFVNPARRETVVLDGGPNSYVYRTRLRFTDVTPNSEVEMPFAAPCGNPIRYGLVGRYVPGLHFEYLGESEVVPEPTPAPAAVEAVPDPAPAPAPEPASEEPQPEPEPVPVAVVEETATALAGIELPVQNENPSFRMTRLNDGTVALELAASSGAQFLLTVPAVSVRYADGRFSFDASGLPAGLTVPVSAEVIAEAAVRQLTAPAEKPEKDKAIEAKSQTA
jgi:hypothetical protein